MEIRKKKLIPQIRHVVQEENFFVNYHLSKATWLEGIIGKKIGNMMYIIKHPRWKVRRHINQIKKKIYPKQKGTGSRTHIRSYDMFEVPKPSPIQQNRTSKPKSTPTGTMKINPKRQK